ncbi:AraC family transcriptional regulator, partial [Pantoea sp.]|uniref:helix-turn-helix transcriptional regulator n=1 Tax=Pantoea sp. TaxID=69393 RepID=UPI0028B1454A
HDGHAPDTEGFTYVMLYLPQTWVAQMMERRGLGDIANIEAAFRSTLNDDALLACAIQQAWYAVHHGEGRLARDQSLDHLLTMLSRHLDPRPGMQRTETLAPMQLLRDYLHDFMAEDIGLEELARLSGIDRFRLSRQFKKAFGQSPHAYLVRLRLRSARSLLAQGVEPAQVALQVGFS